VATLTSALRDVLFDGGTPIAVVPAESAGIHANHAAAMSAAVEADAPVSGDHAAVIMATSGSTGEPQGVVLPKDGLLTAGRLGAAALGSAGLWLTALPVTGIGGLLTVVRALLAGGDPLSWPGLGGASGFTPESFDEAARETLRRAKSDGVPAYVSLVPTQLTRIIGHPAALDTLAGFQAVVVGGASLAIRARSAAQSAGVRVVATYGATETCGGVVYDGKPLPGVEVEITDEGAIAIGGPTLALGYRLRPDLDKRRFQNGMFITSDLGELIDGSLRVLGRTDSTIKVGGVKVSMTGITEALLSHPRVIDAVTVAEPNAEWGLVPRAYVLPDRQTLPDTEDYAALVAELAHTVRSKLGRAATPRKITLTDLLPQLHSGKSGVAPGAKPDTGTAN
jgi:O-succinylbenzoic acid--CoA ligase